MTAKQYLEKHKTREQIIAVKQREIDRMRTELSVPSGERGERVKSSMQDDISQRVEKIDTLEREVQQLRAEQWIIKRAVQKVPDEKLRTILEGKYIYGMRLTDVACNMGYSYDWMRHLHRNALRAFENSTHKNTF